MKRMLTVLLVLAMLIATAALAEADDSVLRVGMECNYAPFNWTQPDEGEYTVPLASGGYADGYDVRIARRVADYLDRELVIVPSTFDALPMGLTTGDIDCIIAGMSPTEERRMTIDFSDPYYESDLVIVVRKDGDYANATSLADFAGARIVGQINTFHDTVIDQIPDVQHQTPMEDFPTMLVALSSGSVDGYVSERPSAESAAATNPDVTYIAFEDGMGFEADPENTTVAVGVKKGSELLGPINEALATISEEERVQIMGDALAAQPSAEASEE